MTVNEVARLVQVSPSAVRDWIRKGYLTANRNGRSVSIPHEPNAGFLSARLDRRLARPTPTYVPPEISRYSQWHSVLDELAWVLKAVYSHPTDLKRKRFRLDILFARYVTLNEITLDRMRKDFPPSEVPVQVWEDLQRGWYNELAFNFPPRASTLGLSFSDVNANQAQTAIRFLFPSWRITTAYYAIYFFLRAITRLKQRTFRLQEHRATLKNFKSCALRPLERTVWQFPLNIAFRPGERHDIRTVAQLSQRHLRYRYACHPRAPHRSPMDACRWIRGIFRYRSRGKQHYTLFDYLHDFRIWANYLEIEHLLNLRGAGYKAFLDQSLSLILFFVGGIAELVFLACSGETKLRNRGQRFFDVLAASSAEFADQHTLMAFSQRVDLFMQLGFLRRGISYLEKPDPNLVRIRFDDTA